MKATAILLLSLLTLPSAAHAVVEVHLTLDGQSPRNVSRYVGNKVCTKGTVYSVEFKGDKADASQFQKYTVVKIQANGKVTAQLQFKGTESGAGVSLTSLIGTPVQVEACENGDFKFTAN